MLKEDFEREHLKESVYQLESRMIEELSLGAEEELKPATIIVEGIKFKSSDKNIIVRDRQTLPF